MATTETDHEIQTRLQVWLAHRHLSELHLTQHFVEKQGKSSTHGDID